MKIGIMTFCDAQDNYGQILQCYALQSFLRKNGHEPYLIRYLRTQDIARNPLWLRLVHACNPRLLANYFRLKYRAAAMRREYATHDRRFDEFRARHIVSSDRTYASLAELQAAPPAADAYLVGSDQTWNFGGAALPRIRDALHAYFLDFGTPDTPRLSYAASWGRTDIADDYAREITPLLARFRYVSVREHSGIALCRRCGRQDAEAVADPTLLLAADDYRALYRQHETRVPQGKYLLLYLLGNECRLNRHALRTFARKRGLSVVYVTGNAQADSEPKTFATIPEWLHLIDGAQFVVTNSFHGCVFSTIFRTPFAAVPLTGKAASMNTRLDTLFDLAGIAPRYVKDKDFSALETAFEPRSEFSGGQSLLDALTNTNGGG